MAVVKKQNAFASRFESPYRQSNDLLATDAVMPIVGVSVGGKYCQPTRREFVFDDIGPRQAGNAEERREIFGIAQCRADVRNAPVDLATHFLDRQLAEPGRMILAVRADRVTFLVDAAHGGGEGAGHLTDQEVSRFDALRSEN